VRDHDSKHTHRCRYHQQPADSSPNGAGNWHPPICPHSGEVGRGLPPTAWSSIVITLPQTVMNVLTGMRIRITEWWEDPETDREQNSPLFQLVLAFSGGAGGSETVERLGRLALYAARRALPCWELYCDGNKPRAAVEAVDGWLRNGTSPDSWDPLALADKPAYQGHPIIDCRACDTGCAAEAAAYVARYARDCDLIHAYRAIAFADMAFDQSPLCGKDHFREWLLDIAVPGAYERKDLTLEECEVLREYSAHDISAARDRDATYWNSWLRI
jgi:hypothetical protein